MYKIFSITVTSHECHGISNQRQLVSLSICSFMLTNETLRPCPGALLGESTSDPCMASPHKWSIMWCDVIISVCLSYNMPLTAPGWKPPFIKCLGKLLHSWVTENSGRRALIVNIFWTLYFFSQAEWVPNCTWWLLKAIKHLFNILFCQHKYGLVWHGRWFYRCYWIFQCHSHGIMETIKLPSSRYNLVT